MDHVELPLLIAHRGESADAPENTLAAVELAWRRGAAAVEIDVRVTADDRVLVIHDADTERVTGVSRVVAESRAADLTCLDAGTRHGPAFAGEPIPLFTDVLGTVPPGGRLFVEIKPGPEAVGAVTRDVQASGLGTDQVVFIAFNADVVAAVKKRLPAYPAYWLLSRTRADDGRWAPGLADTLAHLAAIGADGLDVAAGGVDRDFVERFRATGLGLYVWTVDEPTLADRLCRWGVDGITTNRCQWLKARLGPGRGTA
jgi:glycerophosphoryl diester phosphodiesterase